MSNQKQPEVTPSRSVGNLTLAEIRRQIEAMRTANYTKPERHCDMVMKGGITSGVVYPLTIAEVAKKHRLHSIGGASAGAIAACLAAAAEHRRQTALGSPESGDGFKQLAALPEELGHKLETLFQPSKHLKRPFKVLMASMGASSGKPCRIALSLIRQRLAWFAGGVAVSLLIAGYSIVVIARLPISSHHWLRIVAASVPSLVIAIGVGLLAAVFGLGLLIVREMPRNGFGLCDGLSGDGTNAALTPWLALKVNQVAGRSAADAMLDDNFVPLMLGELWGMDALDSWEAATAGTNDFVGGPPEWQLRAKRQVDLQVMVTDLTTRRPFRLPFETDIWLFAPDEWKCYFPEPVVAQMQTRMSDELHPDTGEILWHFPGARDLPIVVMARMSLSFPGLISAIPLYAVDYTNNKTVTRHWISDGGIGSNFPLHFFDRLIPSRPTFGINLAPILPTSPNVMTWRYRIGQNGNNVWPRVRSLSGLPSFVGAILDTMQNWADSTLSTLKGYADRVVEVRLNEDEGGMNLRMPEERILRLAHRGLLAGQDLDDFDWQAHRVTRYRLAMTRLNDALDHFRDTWQHEDPNGGARYPRLLLNWNGPGHTWLAANRTADMNATEELIAAIENWKNAGYPALATDWPKPAPDLRMAPR